MFQSTYLLMVKQTSLLSILLPPTTTTTTQIISPPPSPPLRTDIIVDIVAIVVIIFGVHGYVSLLLADMHPLSTVVNFSISNSDLVVDGDTGGDNIVSYFPLLLLLLQILLL